MDHLFLKDGQFENTVLTRKCHSITPFHKLFFLNFYWCQINLSFKESKVYSLWVIDSRKMVFLKKTYLHVYLIQ